MKVINFRNIENGTMVKRSEHCQKEMCLKGKPQIGIITDMEFFSDNTGDAVAWPVIMWEGCKTMPSCCHPALVDMYRAKDRKRITYIEMVE